MTNGAAMPPTNSVAASGATAEDNTPTPILIAMRVMILAELDR